MRIEIVRLTRSVDTPTFGVLLAGARPFCVSLERPDRMNAKNDGCIPAGEYECVRRENRKLHTGKFLPIAYEVLNVPNRSGILFHAGNTIEDTRGCILLGKSFEALGIISQSQVAMTAFHGMLKTEPRFQLQIRYLPELY